MNEIKVLMWSQTEFGLYAEIIPRGTPTSIAARIPVPVSIRDGMIL